MKKIWIVCILSLSFLLGGCEDNPQIIEDPIYNEPEELTPFEQCIYDMFNQQSRDACEESTRNQLFTEYLTNKMSTFGLSGTIEITNFGYDNMNNDETLMYDIEIHDIVSTSSTPGYEVFSNLVLSIFGGLQSITLIDYVQYYPQEFIRFHIDETPNYNKFYSFTHYVNEYQDRSSAVYHDLSITESLGNVELTTELQTLLNETRYSQIFIYLQGTDYFCSVNLMVEDNKYDFELRAFPDPDTTNLISVETHLRDLFIPTGWTEVDLVT